MASVVGVVAELWKQAGALYEACGPSSAAAGAAGSGGLSTTRVLMGSSAPTPNDAYVATVYVVFLLALNWGVRLFVVAPFAHWLLRRGPKKAVSARAMSARVVKFSQAAMEAAFYGGFFALGLRIVPRQPWIWPSKHWWIGFSSGSHAIMADDFRAYYLFYGARYVAGAISVALEPKRKDLVAMQLHHGVTVAVVAISYLYGWNRIGAVVMLLLDPADVPLHLAKMFKYTADAAKAGAAPGAVPTRTAAVCSFCADRLFELFAVFFFLTRNVLYAYVCWSAHVEATRYFPKGAPEWACVALLETLYVLQCYWMFLIIQVAVKMAQTGNAEDVRSDDEDDEDDDKAD